MRKVVLLFAAALSLQGCAHAPVADSPVLPLRSVRLYDSGIGYFERTGTADGRAGSALPVPAAHLDDAIKTLVVTGKDGRALVRGIQFPSSTTPGLARALAGLPAEPDASIGRLELLRSLRGAQVEVTGRRTVRGRLVDVVESAGKADAGLRDDSDEASSDRSGEAISLVLLNDAGAVVTVAEREIGSVRPLDAALAARVGKAAESLAPRSQARHPLTLLASSGEPLTLGYVAETPLWRTTWRLVLDGDGKRGLLQGWALVHNDTDEDWNGVRIELVNGRPDSFLFPLAAPRYARRELVHPDEPMSSVPQLLHQSPDDLWGDEDGQAFGLGGMGMKGSGAGAGGFGAGFGGAARSRAVQETGESDALSVGNLAKAANAEGVEAGALFSYRMESPVDVRGHNSAMLPFLHDSIEAEPVSWVAEPGALALAGARVVNSTRQTLPPGPLAVFADGGLAGETLLQRLKPGEHVFVQFGRDLDVSLEARAGSSTGDPRKVRFEQGVLEEHFLRTTRTVFVVENRSGRRRALWVGLPVVKNARVEGADALDFDRGTEKPVARFDLEPQRKVERPVTFEEALVTRTPLARVDSARLQALAAAPSVEDSRRLLLGEAAKRRKLTEETEKAQTRLRAEIAATEKEIERLRADLSALSADRAPAAADAFARRLLAAEERLDALGKRLEQLQDERGTQETAVREALEELAP